MSLNFKVPFTSILVITAHELRVVNPSIIDFRRFLRNYDIVDLKFDLKKYLLCVFIWKEGN